MTIKPIVALAIALSACLSTYAQESISLSSFGVQPNSYTNASPALRKAIESCQGKQNVTLTLPGGRIDLWPEGSFKKELYISNTTEDDTLSKEKSIAFLLEGLNNITIEGNNTLVVLHGKMESFAFIKSKDVTIKNIQFDYERPTMSELKIVSVTDKVVKVEVHRDTRYAIENGRIVFYGEGWRSRAFHTIVSTPSNGVMRYGSFSPFMKAQAKETGCREVTFVGDFSKANLQEGSILTIRDPYRDNSGAFIAQSKDVRVENVKMRYMHGLGIISQFSENITLKKVDAAPAPESGRVIASFADCFHFSGCKGKILVDSCSTSGSHDDPMNVHGTHLKIVKIAEGKRLVVRFMHHQTYGFEAFFAGDSISFVQPQTLMPLAVARIKEAKLISKREMEIEIDGRLSDKVKEGDCIENLTWTPEVTVRGCRFEKTNTRGMLITTRRKVLIENNTFYRTGMHAILIANDASSWFESGAVHDVTIRNNTFDECGYNSAPGGYVIAIAPENHQLAKGFMVHRNIRIEGNTFRTYDYPIVTARSTDRLTFVGNRIVRSNAVAQAGEPRPAFYLNACDHVVIKGNKVEGWDTLSIQADNMSRRSISSQGFKF